MTFRGARTSTALLGVGAVLLWAALTVGGAARGIIDADPFSQRLAATLSDPRVASYVAARITDGIVAQRPNLVSVRTMIESAVGAVVTTSAFRAAVRSTARIAHHSLFESAGRNVVLSLPDVSVLVRGALERASPEIAAKIPPGIEATIASPEAQRAFTRFIAAWALVARTLWVAYLALGLGILAIVAAIWVAPDRQTALVRAGGALVAVAIALLAIFPARRIVAAAVTPDPALRGVVQGLWAAYFGVFTPLALMVGSVGIVLAAAGSTMLEAADPLVHAKAVVRGLTAAVSPLARLGRAAVLIAAGTCAAIFPAGAAAGVMIVAGLFLIYVGLREVFRLVLANVPGESRVSIATVGPRPRAWRTVAVVAAVLIAVLGGAALFVFRTPPIPPETAGVVTICNGAAQLCGRRVDQVVFPAAHNAMSNAEIPGWLFPHQNHAVSRQLTDGVRALLIDVHYGVPAGEHVITDFNREGTSEQKIEGVLGPEATAAALRIRSRFLGHETGPSGLYFCHGFCELGAYPVGPALQDVRAFLMENPGEVVVIVVEDYVTPEDLAGAFKEAGLMDLIYTGPIAGRYPMLRQLIDQGQPLLVFTESGKPSVPGFRPAFEAMQETPYTFHTAADFSCKPNRGGTTAPLFQINHWIESTPAPKPSNAEIVNAYDVLLRRARLCQEQRHRLPNIIAVDFYDVGDLFRVARTLNGLDEQLARKTTR